MRTKKGTVSKLLRIILSIFFFYILIYIATLDVVKSNVVTGPEPRCILKNFKVFRTEYLENIKLLNNRVKVELNPGLKILGAHLNNSRWFHGLFHSLNSSWRSQGDRVCLISHYLSVT